MLAEADKQSGWIGVYSEQSKGWGRQGEDQEIMEGERQQEKALDRKATDMALVKGQGNSQAGANIDKRPSSS